MLDKKGFDLWADGYDKAVGILEEANTYPFAGYKEVLGGIFQEILSIEKAKVLDIGFGTGKLTTKLHENGCEIYFVIDELRNAFPDVSFEQKSYCSGIISIQKPVHI